jgi:chromate transporter
MVRALCPDLTRRLLAVAAAAIALAAGSARVQLLVVIVGAAAGVLLCRAVRPRHDAALPLPYRALSGALLLLVLVVLLVALPLAALASGLPPLHYAAAFYRSGALVFGGGHVVLPLLEDAVVAPGWIAQSDFLAGYGAAQAVPGPMFTLAAFLGARLPGAAGGVPGAVLALAAIFLPGLLTVAGVLPMWQALAAHRLAVRAIAGVGAVVVGLLAAALYDPVWLGAVHAPADVLIAAAGFALLQWLRLPVLGVVALCVLGSLALA